LDIDIISSEEEDRQKRRSEVKFIVHLRKTKRDKYEWMEVVISPANYHTKRSFHITFRWLVASSVKIDTQVQLLQRRCSQYGLQLISTTCTSLDSKLYLHPVSTKANQKVAKKAFKTSLILIFCWILFFVLVPLAREY
jgi:hydroxylamine reductase (hybrid-cluster protein)